MYHSLFLFSRCMQPIGPHLFSQGVNGVLFNEPNMLGDEQSIMFETPVINEDRDATQLTHQSMAIKQMDELTVSVDKINQEDKTAKDFKLFDKSTLENNNVVIQDY